MKRFFRVLACLLAFVLVFLGLEGLFWDNSRVCTTWRKITHGQPRVLVMGSSHAHTGIIPALLGRDTAILSNDAASMKLTYQHLRTVLHYYTPETVVLEAQVLLDDLYDRLRGDRKSLLLDAIDGIPNPLDKLRTAAEMLDFEDIPFALSQLTRPGLTWSRWQKKESRPRDIDGFVSRNTYAHGQLNGSRQAAYMANTASLPLAPENLEYFGKFLALAEKKGIRVVLVHVTVAMPAAEEAALLRYAGEMGCEVMDFQSLLSEKVFSVEDYNDSEHCNRRGAAIFTPLLRERLLEAGIDPGETAPWYSGEGVEYTGEGLWRYTMTVSDGSPVTYLLDGQPVDTNLLPLPPEEAHRVSVRCTDREGERTLAFMTPSSCLLEDKGP